MNFKTIRTTIVIAAALTAGITSTHAASVLLGGWDGSSGQTGDANGTLSGLLQDASAVGNVTFELNQVAGSQVWGVYVPLPGNNTQQSAKALWGLSSFTPAANADSNLRTVVTYNNVGTFDMVVSNTGTGDLTLDSLHWYLKRDSTASAGSLTFSYQSGNLTAIGGGSSVVDVSGSLAAGYDFALSSIVSDLTLAPTETATFRMTSGTSAARLRFDNVAISGTVIPEPSAALLGALGMLLLLRRRR